MLSGLSGGEWRGVKWIEVSMGGGVRNALSQCAIMTALFYSDVIVGDQAASTMFG